MTGTESEKMSQELWEGSRWNELRSGQGAPAKVKKSKQQHMSLLQGRLHSTQGRRDMWGEEGI